MSMVMDELAEPLTDEAVAVILWRESELERAGYPLLLAGELASTATVDLHDAIRLIQDGCTPELALRILL